MIWRGTVIRVGADGSPTVEIPRRAPGYTFGPLATVEIPGLCDGAHGTGQRCDARATFAVGDRVLLAEIEGDPERLVVIGRARS